MALNNKDHAVRQPIKFRVDEKVFTKMNPSYYSPPTTFSENSMNSDASVRQFGIPDTEAAASDEESDDEEDRLNKKRIHRNIEARRRETEGKHMNELSSLIPHWCDTKPSKLPQLTLLQMAADLLGKINMRYQYDSLLPSHLTQDEVNFLNLEASNAFLFVTTIEPTAFRLVHVTDSIERVLHFRPEQWRGQDLFQFLHPDDLLHVRNQLSSIAQYIDNKPSFKCRIQQGNHSYSSVNIDGILKKVDPSLKPVSDEEDGEYVFIGICNLPLISEYSEKNLSLHKHPQALIFSCRCSPNDWKIFLVDCSVSTLPSISVKSFRDKSILEFISTDDRSYVHQRLTNATLTGQDELIVCHFIYPSTEIFSMVLEIKPLVNSVTNRTNCLELIFKHVFDLVNNDDFLA